MVKKLGIVFCMMLVQLTISNAQEIFNPVVDDGHKGEIYTYWGWNRAHYTNSTIHFTGPQYDFRLYDVFATDRQSEFKFETYLKPGSFSIPQFNFRIGYYFHLHWDFSMGTDHMKYVMKNNRTATINGSIAGTETVYDGIYDNETINLTEDFLTFEHTDGLNYVNAELRHTHDLFEIKNLGLYLKEGFGLGFMLPKTNAALVGYERHDDFHLSGFGLHGLMALELRMFKYFSIQSEAKGGWIDMPHIRTTEFKNDRASQDFFFFQYNILFALTMDIN